MVKIGEKEYYESYARITLIDIYNKKLKQSILDDKPDIQDFINNIGIEVTRAIPNEIGITDSIVNETFGKNMKIEDIQEKIKKKFKSFSGEIGSIDEINYIAPYKGMVDTTTLKQKIVDSIKEKNKKSVNYKKFKENDLYIFTENSFLDIDDISEIINNAANKCFDIIFINCIDSIYICSSSKIEKIKIKNMKLACYKNKTMKELKNK